MVLCVHMFDEIWFSVIYLFFLFHYKIKIIVNWEFGFVVNGSEKWSKQLVQSFHVFVVQFENVLTVVPCSSIITDNN